MNQLQSNVKYDSNRVKEYAKKKIEQIELIQKDLDDLKNCECFQKDEILNSLARMNATLVLGTAINLLQELIGVYENVLKGKSMK